MVSDVLLNALLALICPNKLLLVVVLVAAIGRGC